ARVADHPGRATWRAGDVGAAGGPVACRAACRCGGRRPRCSGGGRRARRPGGGRAGVLRAGSGRGGGRCRAAPQRDGRTPGDRAAAGLVAVGRTRSGGAARGGPAGGVRRRWPRDGESAARAAADAAGAALVGAAGRPCAAGGILMPVATAVLVLVLSALVPLPWALSGRPLRVEAGAGRGESDRRAGPDRRVDPAVLLDITRSAIVAGASVPGALGALAEALPP